jgi:hypothetical protein
MPPNKFPIKSGIRQGCPLSATLFNIYLSFIARKLANDCNPTVPPVTPRGNALFYADDIVLIANSHRDLQVLFSKLKWYCMHLQLTIDFDKTHFLACNCPADMRNKPFLMNNIPKYPCKSATYLGVTITDTASITTMLDKRITKAESNAKALASTLKAHGLIHVKHVKQIVQAKVLQPLLYACEVWAPHLLATPCKQQKMTPADNAAAPVTHAPNTTQLQKLQAVVTSCLSSIYRLPSGTSTIALILEFGIPPITSTIAQRYAKFLERMSPPAHHINTAPPMFTTYTLYPLVRDPWASFLTGTLKAPCTDTPDTSSLSPAEIDTLATAWFTEQKINPSLHDDLSNPKHRIISTYLQQIWHGKIGQHHPIFDNKTISFTAYMNCIRFRTMNIPAPVYTLPRKLQKTDFENRKCNFGCTIPADLFHILQHCPHTTKYVQQNLGCIPLAPIDIFDINGFDMHTVAITISEIMRSLQKKSDEAGQTSFLQGIHLLPKATHTKKRKRQPAQP